MDDVTPMTELYDVTSPGNWTAANVTSASESALYRFLSNIVTPTLFSLITLLGASGNSLVIYVILSNHNMRTVTNLLLLNLAVADLCFVGIVPPVTAYSQVTASWPFGNAACKLMHYVVNVTAYVTVYTLVLVSVIRYMTIVHSVRTAPIRTRRNVLAAVGAIWVAMLSVNVPILWSYGLVEGGECNQYSMEIGRRVFSTFFAFAYVIPLGVIGVISVAILRHITGNRASSMVHQKKTRSADRKRQVGRLLILVVVVFALLWLPIHVFLLLVFFYGPPPQADWHYVLFILCTGLAYFNSCVNPIIYNRTSKDFRDAFRSAVGCRKPQNVDETGAGCAVPLKANDDPQGAGGQGNDTQQATGDVDNDNDDCADGKIQVVN